MIWFDNDVISYANHCKSAPATELQNRYSDPRSKVHSHWQLAVYPYGMAWHGIQDLLEGKFGDNVDASVYERVEMFHTDSVAWPIGSCWGGWQMDRMDL